MEKDVKCQIIIIENNIEIDRKDLIDFDVCSFINKNEKNLEGILRKISKKIVITNQFMDELRALLRIKVQMVSEPSKEWKMIDEDTFINGKSFEKNVLRISNIWNTNEFNQIINNYENKINFSGKWLIGTYKNESKGYEILDSFVR